MWAGTETIFLKPMLLKTDKTGLTSGLFMGDFSIVQVSFYEGNGDVTWNARGATRAQGPLQPVEATHKENNK